MSYESAENSCGFGAENLNGGCNSNFGVDSCNRTSGFGVENPSCDPNDDYEGIVGSSVGVTSVRDMLNINAENTQGIAGGQVYSGNISGSYGDGFYEDDYIDGLCDTIEVDNDQSWVDGGSIFGSAIKIVSDLYNKYFPSESKVLESIVNDADNTIVAAIEELSSGSWDSSYRNIQLDGCNEGELASSDERDTPWVGRESHGIDLNGSGGSILSVSSSGNTSGSE
jgi:hypothetical protein